jgi:hypothetical protein
LSRILEKWQFGGIMTWSSGSPLNFTSSTNTVNNAAGNTPDVVGTLPEGFGKLTYVKDGIVFFQDLKQVTDPSVSRMTTLQSVQSQSSLKAIADSNGNLILQNPAVGTFGNLGLGTMNGLSSFGLDLNLVKRVTVGEGKTFEFRLDAINALNHPVFGSPNTDINNTNFGRITSAGAGRIVVGNLRLSF